MSRASVPFSEAVDQRRCYRGDVSLLESSRSASFQYSPASWTWSCRRRRRRIIASRRSPRLAAAAPLGELVPARRAVSQGGCSLGGDFERKGGNPLLSVFPRRMRGRASLNLVTCEPARRSATGASA